MPGTTTMNISLPEELKAFAQQRAADKAYANPSDYVRALIREDQKRSQEERLEALLLEGLASGRADDLDLEEIKREVKKRLAARSLRAEG